jgi:thiaminase
MDIIDGIAHEVAELNYIKMSKCISTYYSQGYQQAIEDVEAIINGYRDREHQEAATRLFDQSESPEV